MSDCTAAGADLTLAGEHRRRGGVEAIPVQPVQRLSPTSLLLVLTGKGLSLAGEKTICPEARLAWPRPTSARNAWRSWPRALDGQRGGDLRLGNRRRSTRARKGHGNGRGQIRRSDSGVLYGRGGPPDEQGIIIELEERVPRRTRMAEHFPAVLLELSGAWSAISRRPARPRNELELRCGARWPIGYIPVSPKAPHMP